MGKLILFLFIFILVQCKPGISSHEANNLTYLYSNDSFTMTIPKDWKYIKEQGEDSFIGLFVSKNDTLNFDCSRMGYANHLDELFKEENIQTDSTSAFVRKIIYPKIVGQGITGIYIQSRKSHSNFQMNGRNLSSKNQELALHAFRTIELKNQ